MSLLSKTQKRILAQLARRVWEGLPLDARREAAHNAADEQHPLPSDNQAFTWWRRKQQYVATGAKSLTALRQEDYLVCKLHFEMLERTKGDAATDVSPSRAATRTLGRLVTDDTRRAGWLLQEALRERDLPRAYAESICRRQFRTSLSEATAKQLWCLIFTVRNRRAPAPEKSTTDQPF